MAKNIEQKQPDNKFKKLAKYIQETPEERAKKMHDAMIHAWADYDKAPKESRGNLGSRFYNAGVDYLSKEFLNGTSLKDVGYANEVKLTLAKMFESYIGFDEESIKERYKNGEYVSSRDIGEVLENSAESSKKASMGYAIETLKRTTKEEVGPLKSYVGEIAKDVSYKLKDEDTVNKDALVNTFLKLVRAQDVKKKQAESLEKMLKSE